MKTNIAGDLEIQTKNLTLHSVVLDFIEGYRIIISEVLSIIRESIKKWKTRKDDDSNILAESFHAHLHDFRQDGRQTNGCRRKTRHNLDFETAPEETSPKEDQEDTATILYGFRMLAKCWCSAFQWAASLCVDSRPGVYPSKAFAFGCYIFVIIGFFVGVAAAEYVLTPLTKQILPGLMTKIYKLIYAVIFISELGYISSALLTMTLIVYHRRFMHDFIIYHCSFITLTRSFQRRKVVEIFVVTSLFSYLSEPFFAFASLSQDVNQPEYWPTLSLNQFYIMKYIVVFLFTAGASAISALGTIFPMITSFLMVSIAEYVRLSLSKQMSRFKKIHLQSRMNHPDHLSKLIDPRTIALIREYSCDTLTMDWPELSGDEEEPGDESNSMDTHGIVVKSVKSLADINQESNLCLSSHERTSADSLAPRLDQRRKSLQYRIGGELFDARGTQERRETLFYDNHSIRALRQSHVVTTGSLLFLYKNLIKTLSELKGVIQMYESRFGSIHFLMICSTGLTVAQWVVAGLTQARLMQESRQQELPIDPTNSERMNNTIPRANIRELLPFDYLSSFAFRVGVGVLTFVLQNISVFLRNDELPSRMVKIRSQLFKLNVDLACSSLEQQASRPSPRGDKELTMSRGPTNFRKTRQAKSNDHHGRQQLDMDSEGDWLGLDQIWSLYDQVERMSIQANFRLTSNTYYSRNCLLTIFGREISLILFYIQIIDIYSYA